MYFSFAVQYPGPQDGCDRCDGVSDCVLHYLLCRRTAPDGRDGTTRCMHHTHAHTHTHTHAHTHTHTHTPAGYCASLPNSAPVCVKCGEADPLVCILGWSWHPVFCGPGHWTAHLLAVPGEHFQSTGRGGEGGSDFVFSLPCLHVQGPHIASVTLAAWSCMSLDFPEPPYPDKCVCVCVCVHVCVCVSTYFTCK